MKIPYRMQKILKRVLTVLLIVAVAVVLVLGCWYLWLQRFVVYTRDQGAVLDFEKDPVLQQGQLAEKPEQETVSIYYNEGENAITPNTELTRLVGYYVDEKALRNGVDEVRAQIAALPKGTPVMMDVKNIYGDFFYSSQVSGRRSSKIDPAAMDALLEYLDSSGMYTIARFPALRDYEYGLNHVPDGVPHSSGGYLYQDDGGCYWLNPDSGGTRAYIVDIIQELKGLGFDEVVLTEFRFPQTDSILYNGNKTEALSAAAAALVKSCGTSYFGVSFTGSGNWTLPEGRTRLYMENVEPSEAADIAANSGLPDPDVNLVFVTELYDTRFDAFGVMRPLEGAH